MGPGEFFFRLPARQPGYDGSAAEQNEPPDEKKKRKKAWGGKFSYLGELLCNTQR
jgi:hypothetical protein